MKLEDLIKRLHEHHIQLSLTKDDQLKVTADKGAMTPDLMALLKDNKAQLLAFAKAQRDNKLEAISPRQHKAHAALSAAQQRLWYTEQLAPGAATYHVPLALKIEGHLDLSLLKKTFNYLIKRHESLRTSFIEINGEVKQHISNSLSIDVKAQPTLLKLSDKTAIAALAGQLLAEPFDLSQAPLMRVNVVSFKTPNTYLLLVNLHHLITDGWSNQILLKEIAATYIALAENTEPSLPPISIQYADYSEWQQSKPTHSEGLDFWEAELSNIEPLRLPTDKLRPTAKSGRGHTYNWLLHEDTHRRLQTLAAKHQVSDFAAYLALYQVFLHKLSSQEQIAIGIPTAGRHHESIQHTIGFFVNTLTINAPINPSESFLDLAKSTKQKVLEATAHDSIPFDTLVEQFATDRDRSITPFFQVMMAYQKRDEQLSLNNLGIQPLELDNPTAKFDLTLGIDDAPEGCTLSFEYDTDLFDQASIEGFAEGFMTLIEQICSAPEQAISHHSLLNTSKQEAILACLRGAQITLDNTPLVKRFQQVVATYPDHPAVVFNNQTLTYQALDERSTALAATLQGLGIKPNQPVVISLERSLERISTIIAAIKCGAFFVPVDPAYPDERLQDIIEDANAQIIISDHFISDIEGRTQLTADALINLAKESKPFTPVDQDAEAIAYCIYTSGSTGKPKGVPIAARNLYRLIDDVERFEFGHTKRIAHLCHVAFDAAMWEVFGALLHGSTLVGITKDELLDIEKAAARLQQHEVTHVLMTVALFNLFAEIKADAFIGVEWLGTGGEAPSAAACLKILEHSRPRRLLNAYGPAENTVVTTTADLEIEQLKQGLIPLGSTCANTHCFVVDDNLNLCPFGVTGQLAIAGDGLSAGYVNLPEVTRKRFVPNPFESEDCPHATLYLTGDNAVINRYGELFMKGRQDDQIKLRGFRIELEEIKQALLASPQLSDAVVSVSEGDNPQLNAFVCPINKDQTPDVLVKTLKEQLARKLPHFMLPSGFAVVSPIPLTANGKVDKTALNTLPLIATTAYKAPETALEQTVADSFKTILGLHQDVGLYDDFFALGGQSLLATRLVTQLKDSTGKDLRLRDLFDHPSVELLAAFLEEASHTQTTTTIKRPDNLPLSYSQQRLWFIEQLGAGSLYHMPFALRIQGHLQAEALEQAFGELIHHHESLRTSFETGEDKSTCYQVIKLQTNFRLQRDTFAALETDLIEPVTALFEAPFNLAKGPLLRAALFTHDQDNEHSVLVLCLHHIIADGWSMEVLLRDLFAFYQYKLGASVHPPKPLNLQYADFTLLQRQKLEQVETEQLTFWQENLDNCPNLSLPTDLPRPSELDSAGGEVRLKLPETLSNQVKALAVNEGCSLFMVSLAAFHVLLSKYSLQQDFAIGTPMANRGDGQFEDVIGLFLNTLAIRNQHHEDERFTDFLHQVKTNTLSAFDHQDLPFDKLIDELNLGRDLSQTPVFQAMLILQTASDNANKNLLQGELFGLTLKGLENVERSQSAKFDLTLNVIDVDDAIELALEYRTSLFHRATIERMVSHLHTLLARIVSAPDTAINQISLTSDKEATFFLTDAKGPNATAKHYPKASAFHHLIEQQVKLTPQAIAVCDDKGYFTYKELNSKANALAATLIELGVQGAVGLSLYRNRFMSVGLLGILKAGCAYVPIDPETPAERLAFITQDARLSLIVSDSPTGLEAPCSVLLADTIDSTIDENPEIIFSDDSLINIIYTSGSTGKPKGVMVPQQGIINRLHWMQDQYPIGAGDKILQKTPFTFDVSVWELLWPLMTGAQIVFAKKDGHKDPAYLAETLVAHNITHAHFVPSMLSVFLQHDLPELPHLKQLFTSGEALPASLVTDCLTKLPHVLLDNLYGPTEAAIDVTYAPMREKHLKQVPIGRPISNTQILILDSELNLCPIGVPGEIVIGGANLAQGYLNREDLTAESFIANPFPAIASSKLYKTGDLGRYLPDGQVLYLGRTDFQVKIRGQRIELGEIENAITAIEGIHDVVVTAPEVNGEHALVAYYTGPVTDSASLHKVLSAKLPNFMLPQYWQHIDKMPLSKNGKIDRKALPDVRASASDHFVPAETTSEKALCELFGDVLGIPEPLTTLGIQDDFFLRGGHSLKAITLVARIESELGISLPVSDVFLHPTVSSMEMHIQSQGFNSKALPAIEPQDHTKPLPASFNQQRLWLHQSMEKGSTAYHMPLAFWVEGKVDAHRITQALTALVTRHAILRTALTETSGELTQVIHVASNLPFVEQTAESAQLAEKLAADAMQTPFELTTPGAFRAGLIKVDDTDKALFYLVLHHIIADAATLDILLTEFAMLLKGDGQLLSDVPLQYADFAAWQQIHKDAFLPQVDYWAEMLKDRSSHLGVLAKLAHDDTTVQQGAGTLSEILPTNLREAVNTACKTQNLTPFMWYAAAVSLLLAKTGDQDQLTLGIPVAGRHRQGTQNMPGFFVNTLFFSQTLDNSQPVDAFFSATKAATLKLFAHQDVSTEQILARLKREGINEIPARVGFNYFTHHHEQQTVELDGTTFTPIEMPATEAKYDLIISVQDTNSALTITFEYNASLYCGNKLSALYERFEHLLHQMLREDNPSLGEIPLYLPCELDSDQTETEALLPLTPMQRDIVMDQQLTPDNPRNYLGWMQHLSKHTIVDVAALEDAFFKTLADHAALRMRLVSVNETFQTEIWQRILTPTAAANASKLVRVTLDDDSEDALKAYAEDQAYRSMSTDGALFELQLIERPASPAAILLRGHHACLDGISLNTVTQSVSLHYAAIKGLSDKQTKAKDNYLEHVNQSLQQNSVAAQEFWLKKLQGVQPLPAPQGLSGKGYIERSLDGTPEQFAKLSAFCKQHRTTPALFMKALYSLLLNSYCQSDAPFYFTEVIAARPTGHHHTAGCYFGSQPIVINPDRLNQGTFQTLLQDLRTQQRAAKGDKKLSNSLQHRLFPQGANQYLFNFYTLPDSIPFDDEPAALTFFAPKMDTAVNLTVRVKGDHLRLHFSYDKAFFIDNQFLERLLHLSDQVVDGTYEVSKLTLLLPNEPAGRDSAAPPITSQTVSRQETLHCPALLKTLKASLQTHAQAISVKDKNGSLTYQQLDKHSNQLAHRLIAEGIKPKDRVGLHLAASCDYVVGLLATLKAGATYVALDIGYPDERKAFITQDAELACVISNTPADFAIKVVNTKNLTESIEPLAIESASDDSLYIMYTSGSTGQPKGVAISHANFSALIDWYSQAFDFNQNSKTLVISSVGFDLTQKNLFIPLITGGTLIFADMTVFNPALITATIESEQITHLNAAPSACYPWLTIANAKQLLSLEAVLMGGEAIQTDLLIDWFNNSYNQAKLVNMYGPSECTDIATFEVIEAGEPLPESIALGSTPPYVQLHRIDLAGRLLPQGLAGELVITGSGLGQGYIGHAAREEKGFVQLDHLGNAYRTGDLVHEDQHQRRYFLGRTDHQIKVRGIRIEPDEISAQLNQLAGVSQSLVMLNSKEQLVAYVIAEQTPENWRSILSKHLPATHIPQAVHALPTFPLSASGKIDQTALPEIQADTGLILTPKTDDEQALLPLWEAVFEQSPISTQANFFELGGHSLMAATLINKIERQLGWSVTVRDLFEHPSIEALAAAKAHQAVVIRTLAKVNRETFEHRFPLSIAQERLWLIEDIQGPSSMYNMPLAFMLKGKIDEAKLQQSLEQVAHKHQVLNTRLVRHKNSIYQTITDTPQSLEIKHKAATPNLYQQIFDFCQKPFSLLEDSLYRARLLRVHEDEAVLMISMHHLISDGLSMTLFIHELIAAYQGHLPVDSTPLQYLDYSVHQRDWLTQDAQQKQLAYWQQQLEDTPLTQLPLDRPYTAKPVIDGKVESLTLDTAVVTSLEGYAQKHQVSVAMLVMGALQLLLSRYSGQKDIAIGTVTANRPLPELESMLGFFVNTLVIRNQLDNARPFHEHLSNVKDTFFDALSNQDVPFEQVLDRLPLKRDLSHSPLFQVFYSYQQQNDKAFKVEFDDLSIESVDTEAFGLALASKFELSLHVLHQAKAAGPELALSFEYRTALFDQQTIKHLLDHLSILLTAIITQPAVPMAKLPLLRDVEVEAMSEPCKAPIVPDFVESLKQLKGEAIAVMDGETSLSYDELNQRATVISQLLLSDGLKTGDKVALYLEPNVHFMVALLGIIRAGGCYLPLGTDLPKARRELIVGDANCHFVITERALSSAFTGDCLLMDQIDWSMPSERLPLPALSPEDLLYTLYTSGSTGKPKGVEVKHSGESNLLAWYTAAFGYLKTPHQSLILSSLGFDLTQKNFFAPLLTGGTCHLMGKPAFDPVEAAKRIERDQITLINCAPSHLYALLAVTEDEHFKGLASLKVVLLGGEPIQLDRVKAFFKEADCKLINMYGPTECTDITTFHEVNIDAGGQHMPIGKAIPGVDLVVLDESKELLPKGAIGELYIGGVSLAKGYLGQEALTDERFIFHEKLHARLYRTGDLVRWNHQGELVFHGRTDHQVKIRGFRIELQDIEYQLSHYPGVKQALVQATTSPITNDTTLVAYVAIEQGIEASDLNKHLHEHLADYMVPQKLILLSTLPLNPNGKVDRKALPEPDWDLHTAALVLPESDTEKALLTLWQAVLNKQGISTHDNFFMIGGHSLKAAQLVARIRSRFAIDLNLRDLFEADTLVKQAALIDHTLQKGASLPPLVRADEDAVPVLSYAQQRLWLLAQLAPNTTAYNMPGSWLIEGEVDKDALHYALQSVVARHDSLRMVFTVNQGEPVVSILKANQSPIQLQYVDAASLNDAQQMADADAAEPFALDSGQLLRAQLITINQSTHILSMNMHHIISDGTSIGVLLSELFAFYQAETQKSVCPLPEPELQYTDFALWQRSWLQGDRLEQEIDYWRNRLQGVTALLPLPLDHPRAAVQQFKGKEVRRLIPFKLTKAIQAIADNQQATPFMVMLTAWQLLLHKFSQHNDIAVGVPTAGRNQPGTENLIGFFINALVVRTDFSANATLSDLIQQVKSHLLGAFAHEQVPVEMLLNELGLNRNLQYTPVVQCAFNMLSADSLPAAQTLEGLSITPRQSDSLVAKFDLQLNVLQKDTDWLLSLEYNSDIFKPSTINTLLDHFETLLAYCCYQPNTHAQGIQLNALSEPRRVALTPMQRDIYLATLAKPDTLENSLGYAMQLPIDINLDDWEQCQLDIHRRFFSLNAKVEKGHGTFDDIAYLVPNDSLVFDYQYEDLSHLQLDDEAIDKRLRANVIKPYDLSEPLVSYRLMKFRENYYWFTFACHHLVCDGFSGMIHLQLLTLLYENKVKGSESLLPVEDGFKAHVSKCYQQFDTPEILGFWQEQLRHAEPLDVFNPPKKDPQPKLLSHPIPIEHTERVKAYCRQQKITPALYFKCLYALLIKAYTGTTGDFIVTEFNGGRDKTTKDTMACLYHTQPFCFEADTLQGELSALFTSARQHQKQSKAYLQLSSLSLKKLLPESSIGFSFNYLMMPHTYWMLDQEFFGHRYTPNAEGMVDFRVQADGDELCLWLAFHESVFTDNRFLERFMQLSEQCLEGASTTQDLSLLLPDEVTKQAPEELTHSIPSVIEQYQTQVSKTPKALAVSDSHNRLTFSEFSSKAALVTQQLLLGGIRPNQHVAICLPAGTDVALAIWGVIQAGAAYVPIDPQYPKARIEHILKTAEACLIIDEKWMKSALAADIQTVDYPIISKEQRFYTLFTSGSTGLPKGASVSHDNENNLIDWYSRTYQLSTSDKVLIISSLGFDLTQKNLLAPLCTGAELIFYDAPHFDPVAILSVIKSKDVSFINCAPSALYALIEQPKGSEILANHLRVILLGGEAISSARLQRLIDHPSFDAQIVNMYGPTECTDITTARTYTATELKAGILAFSLGEPIQGVELAIIDSARRPLPHGFIGELAIMGTSVGLGYINNPEMNASQFVEIEGKQAYLTGDLAYRDTHQDGSPLIYVGRKDFQVKINGRRLELGEIESVLKAIDGVQDSAVLAINDQLVAFVASSNDKTQIESSWQPACHLSLPSFMHPKRLHVLDQFPLTPNGKLDRKQLATMDVIYPVSIDKEPETPTEQALSRLWQEVLGQPVGTSDNFFETGGDSLSAVKLIAKIEFTFEIKLPVSSLFNAQTIAQQARLIETEQQGFSPVVLINQGDKSSTPLFAIHALGGMVLSYKPLADALGKSQTVYGIQAFGFEEDQTPFTKLSEMVDYYATAIEKTWQNNVQLIGHSFGGIIALEVARELKARGRTVTYLGLIDTHQPVRYLSLAADSAAILKTFVEHNFGKVDLPLSALRVLNEDQMIKKVVNGLNGAVTEDFIRSAIAVIRGFQSQMAGYKAQPIDLPIQLFRPKQATDSLTGNLKEKLFKGKAHSLGFEKIGSSVTVHAVPGDHFSMLSDSADDIAKALLAYSVNRFVQ